MRKSRSPNTRIPSNIHPALAQLVATRISRGITQISLAEALGYHNKTISYSERQERNLSFQLVVDYADFLGYDLILAPKDSPNRIQREAWLKQWTDLATKFNPKLPTLKS